VEVEEVLVHQSTQEKMVVLAEAAGHRPEELRSPALETRHQQVLRKAMVVERMVVPLQLHFRQAVEEDLMQSAHLRPGQSQAMAATES
jgi:hypothetical protein